MRLRSKLIRRLLVLAIGFGLLCSGAGAFYVYRKARIARHFQQIKAQGLAAAATGRDQEAVDLLRLYLQRQPDDIDALVAFAHARPLVPSPKNQQISETIYVLRHLLKLPGQDSRVAEKRQLLDLYVRTRYWTEAEALAKELLPDRAVATKDDVPVVAALTAARYAQHDWQGALDWAKCWSKLAPTDLAAQINLLELVHRTRLFKGLEPYAVHGKLTEVELGDGLAADCQQALAPTSAATTSPSGEADARPLIIRGYGLLNSDKAEDRKQALALFQAAAAQQMDRQTAIVLIRQLDLIGDSFDALSVLRRASRQSPDPQIREALARRAWEVGDWTTVIHATSQLSAFDPLAGSELLAMRASALLRQNRATEAIPIQKALAARQNDEVAAAWAFVLAPLKPAPVDLGQMSKLCSAAADQSAYLRFFLADAEQQLDEPELAISECQRAIQQNSTWAAPATRLSELLTSAGRYEEARQAGLEAKRRQPNYAALVALYRAWDLCLQNALTSGGDELAGKLNELQHLAGDDGQVLCLHADVLGTTGKTGEAAGVIREGLKAGQKTFSQQSLLRLAAISRKYKLGAEGDCLATCRSRFGMTPELAFAEASAELAGGKAAQGAQVFEADRAGAADGTSVGWRLAWTRYLDLAQDPRAAKQIVQLADDYPANVQVQLQTLSVRATMQDRDFMQRTIDRVQRLMGERNVAWRLAKARWLLNFDNRPEQVTVARGLLDEVVKVAPDQPEAHVLLSRCNEREKHIPEAIDQMRMASRLLPGSPAVSLSLARLLEMHGDFEAARLELARISSMPGSDQDQRRSAAILAANAGDPHLALMLAQDASSQSATASMKPDLQLAQLYWNGGNAAEAERILRELLANKPELGTIRFAADVYAMQGRLDEATKTLTLLDRLELLPGIKQLVWADFSNRYVGADAALKQLDQARVVAPDNPQVWKALVSFHLAAGHVEQVSVTIEEGYNRLPADPVLRSLHEQEQTLKAAAAEPGLRALALALLADPSDSSNRVILQTLVADAKAKLSPTVLADRVNQVALEHRQSLPLWMYLAQCDLAAQRVDAATSVLLQAAAQFPAAPEPQQLYVGLLAGQQRWQEVLAAAQKWRQRTLSNPLLADMAIAQASLNLNRPADAMQQLEPYVRKGQTASDAYQAVLTLYGQASLAARKSGTAALMEPLLDQGSRGRLTWMSFAVRNLNASEGAAWLDRVDKLIPPQATAERLTLAQAWTALAAEHSYRPGFENALAILEPLAAQADAQESFVVVCAMAEEQAGRSKDAQAHYRQALKLAPTDVVAINNLAMLLATTGENPGEALTLIQSAINLKPDVPSLHDTKAYVQGKLGKFDEAVASAKTAIDMQPKSVQYRATLAQLLLDSGNRDDAVRALHDLDAQHPDPASEPAALKQQLRSLHEALGGGRTSGVQPAARAGQGAD